MNIHDICTPNQVSKVLGNLSNITTPSWTVCFSTFHKPQLNKVKGSKIRMYLCTLYFLIKAMYKYIRVCSRRKSATSSKGVRFPIFLVLKLHVSMRTNKKHDPPCYILHLQWIGIPFEEVIISASLSIFTRKCSGY